MQEYSKESNMHEHDAHHPFAVGAEESLPPSLRCFFSSSSLLAYTLYSSQRTEMRHRHEANTQVLDLAAAVKDGLLSADAKKPPDIPAFPGDDNDDDVPHVFVCPISLLPMSDPVTLCTGHTFDRANISRWLAVSPRRPPLCPTSMQELWDTSLTPNTTLLHLLRAWLSHRHRHRASRLVSALSLAKGGRARSLALRDLRRLLASAPESRHSVLAAGAVSAVSSLLGRFTSHAVGSEAVAVLSLLPLDAACTADLVQPAKLSLVVDLLNEGSAETRLACTRLLAALVRRGSLRQEMASSPSLLVGLLRLVRRQHPAVVRAGLGLLGALSAHREVVGTLVSVGAARQLVEVMPALEGEALESAVRVVRALCGVPEGRQAVRGCGGAVRGLVGVLVGVTEVCTELALEALLEICREWPEECGGAAVEAGVAAKLLLAMQSGCGASVKRTAAELLKLCSLNYGATMFMSKCKLTKTLQ